MPGEIEERTKAQRLHEGIDIYDTTWAQIVATRHAVGLADEPTKPRL
jgi:LDH2 family malate/lactate/ureidoglycolate dehydrogenase